MILFYYAVVFLAMLAWTAIATHLDMPWTWVAIGNFLAMVIVDLTLPDGPSYDDDDTADQGGY